MAPSAVDSSGLSAWDRFWFSDGSAAIILPVVRLAASMLAIWFFWSHWSEIGGWFAGDGLLSAPQISAFLADAGLGESFRWRWSPLYLIDSATWLRVYLALGVVWAGLTLVGWRSRLPAVLLWLWVVWMANRSLLVSGLEELALVWLLGYLAIAPPLPPRWWAGGLRRWPGGPERWPVHWSGSVAKRLLQLHLTLVLAATGFSMLAAPVWWDGTGVMAIVAPHEIRSINWTMLLSEPWRYELLSHAAVALAVLLPVLLWNRRWRPTAVLLGWLWCLALAALTSQWLYFSCLGAALATFLPENSWLAWNRCPSAVKVDQDEDHG